MPALVTGYDGSVSLKKKIFSKTYGYTPDTISNWGTWLCQAFPDQARRDTVTSGIMR
ncbi:MAG: hypothetical protein GXY18_04190 [Methanomicrobiales archaeon]|nr:hypothetical protein [Methanomicrobiales archaeon]